MPSLPLFAHRGQYPDAAKGGPAGIENEHGIGLPIRHHAGWRYPAYPMFCPLPCGDRRRIIYADRSIPLDNPPSSRRYLPLQGVAGQRFRSISLPHVTPEVLFSFGTLTLLDPLRHALEFIPRPGRMSISIFAQEVAAILQTSKRNVERDCHQLSVHGITAQQLRVELGYFRGKVGLQIDQIGFEDRSPDQIDVQEVGAGAALQELAREINVLATSLRNWNVCDANAGLLGELL